jgi:hypothetical protein
MHFDNGALPGASIAATHHVANTIYREHSGKYIWRASSLLEVNSLGDTYGLYKNYKQNWLMHTGNDGDILREDNLYDFCEQLGNQVDLYTSGLCFDDIADHEDHEDHKDHELVHLPSNIGQILAGLFTLRKGGSFVIKQHTAFEPSTISVIFAAAHFFEEFYLCKPYSSRSTTSETYLVGKGFKGGVYFNHPYIRAMMLRMTGIINKEIPIFTSTVYPKGYLLSIVKAIKSLAETQTEKINTDIELTNKCANANTSNQLEENATVKAFHKTLEPTIIKWFTDNPVLPISDNKKLKMIDAFGQGNSA